MITVKELLEACEKEVSRGHGNKVVYISSDDEGNNFHPLFYLFTELNVKNTEEFNMWGSGNLDKDKHILLG